MLSSDFYCKENSRFRVIPVHPGLTGHAGLHSDPDFMNTIITGDMNTIITGDESWVYGYDPEPVIFLTMRIRLNTTSLKCCLPSTDTIDRRKKFTHAHEGSISPQYKRASLKTTKGTKYQEYFIGIKYFFNTKPR